MAGPGTLGLISSCVVVVVCFVVVGVTFSVANGVEVVVVVVTCTVGQGDSVPQFLLLFGLIKILIQIIVKIYLYQNLAK